jgi:hypothetical protein
LCLRNSDSTGEAAECEIRGRVNSYRVVASKASLTYSPIANKRKGSGLDMTPYNEKRVRTLQSIALIEPGQNVPLTVQNAPGIDVIIPLDIEYQIWITLDPPAPEAW